MAKNYTRTLRDQHQKNICKLFDEACYRHNRWSVWADFVVLAAISIANTVDHSNAESRTKMYHNIEKKYNERELECFQTMLSEIVEALEANPNQDFLGELYMALNLGNEHSGQFFTPYDVCRMMASINFPPDMKERIAERGWISVNDPACGAGALLVAYANECRRPENDINYQTSVLFVAQDLDMIAGCMCYIQLSLLGCPGYVYIGNTLTDPITCVDEHGLIPRHSENIWYTPFFFRNEWTLRRMAAVAHKSA